MSTQIFRDLKDKADRHVLNHDWAQAVQAYEEAEKADPEAAGSDHAYWYNRGFSQLRLSDWKNAAHAFTQSVTINPDLAAGWANLGNCQRYLHEWESAYKSYSVAVVLERNMLHAWQGIAICAEKLRLNYEWISACKEIMELLPNDAFWKNELERAKSFAGKSASNDEDSGPLSESAEMNHACDQLTSAALSYREKNKWLDAADAYREALHRNPGYAPAEKGFEEIRQHLERLSAKVRDFASTLPACKLPYERYLNPYEILALNGRLADMPEGTTLRKLKQRVIQQIQLNDGRADWLEGAEIGESRVRQILNDLDDESGAKARWHWIIYECPELNRFLSHGDPLYFAFFTTSVNTLPMARTPYWQVRDEACGAEDFFRFIHAPFVANFEVLLEQALETKCPELVQALCSGRLPAVDAFDYFRRANGWIEKERSNVKGYTEKLATPEGLSWWKETADPMAWFTRPLAKANALPDECKESRTQLGYALRNLGIALHNEHELTAQALKVTEAALQLLVDESLADRLKSDKADLERILQKQRQEAAEAEATETKAEAASQKQTTKNAVPPPWPRATKTVPEIKPKKRFLWLKSGIALVVILCLFGSFQAMQKIIADQQLTIEDQKKAINNQKESIRVRESSINEQKESIKKDQESLRQQQKSIFAQKDELNKLRDSIDEQKEALIDQQNALKRLKNSLSIDKASSSSTEAKASSSSKSDSTSDARKSDSTQQGANSKKQTGRFLTDGEVFALRPSRSSATSSTDYSSSVDSSRTYRNATGRSYRVPESAHYRLVALESALNQKKAKIDAEKARLESMARKIDLERDQVDTTSQYEIDYFNRKVVEFNSSNDELQRLNDEYNLGVDSFNTELKRVGTPID